MLDDKLHTKLNLADILIFTVLMNMFVGFLQYLYKIAFRLCIKVVKIICKVMVLNNIVRILQMWS